MVEYIPGVLSVANFLIASFVMLFALSFLRKTQNAKDRKPWVFLLIAVIIFFLMQFVNILGMRGFYELDTYRSYFDSMFLAIILFTFVFQYNLILNSELILISRKQSRAEINAKRAALDGLAAKSPRKTTPTKPKTSSKKTRSVSKKSTKKSSKKSTKKTPSTTA